MKIRTRFAPSPTGFMHLGNIRTALLNYLFTHQRNGRLVLRIEDTDQERNTNEFEATILKDLVWLGIKFEEGPQIGGTHGPYCQSDRKEIYDDVFKTLVGNRLVYRCFCTPETLQAKRSAQAAEGKPPRYDRTCLGLPPDKVKQKIAAGVPFVWRFKINDRQRVEFEDMARGTQKFDLAHFSDFTITRSDGSYTFLFTNFVDDWKMEISHVIRGEDHLSNTALQGAMAHALAIKMPVFWHLPMMCDHNGKKLSKRSAHFSLKDLKGEGFLPEAICNYLALVGGRLTGEHLTDEIQDLSGLMKKLDFHNISSTGSSKYDVEKLLWVNHKWIARLEAQDLLKRVKPFLKHLIQNIQIEDKDLLNLIQHVKDEAKTLVDFEALLKFRFIKPTFVISELEPILDANHTKKLVGIMQNESQAQDDFESFLTNFKTVASKEGFKPKAIFSLLRYVLTGSTSGIGIHELNDMLGYKEIQKRIKDISI
ncbi:glutamate--tRNA ligase [Candidatus Babeliales bacterium]|nr:glutamate--tRNA ligase [Candidatus Babeliales bacterium]